MFRIIDHIYLMAPYKKPTEEEKTALNKIHQEIKEFVAKYDLKIFITKAPYVTGGYDVR